MARIRSNVIVQGVSGKFGNQVVFRHMRDGRTILATVPDFSHRKLSTGQKAHHERFKAAAAYAREASHSQPIYAELAAGTAKNAYNIALGDWFHPPAIHQIEVKDGKVRVWASDDVRVAGMRVMILDDSGKIIEQGEATQMDELWWEYAPQNIGKIVAEARDLAGNVAREEKVS